MNFAKKLTSLRQKRGLSQKELSERLGVSWQTVSKWEANQAKPDMEKIIDISDFFGISIDYLLKDDVSLPETVENLAVIPNNWNSSFIFCTQCGKQNQADSRFCSNCGTPISSSNFTLDTTQNINTSYYQANLQMQQEAIRIQQEQLLLERRKLEEAKRLAAEQKRLADIQQQQYNELAKCPRCGSTALSSNKKGYGVGKALIGVAVFGPVGLLAGGVGANKVVATCLKCGHKFKPGRSF